MSLAITAPREVDPTEVAQQVADAVRTLHRSLDETYAGRADIVLPHLRPDQFELIVSGHHVPEGQQLLILLGLIWAHRPWEDTDDECDRVMVDAHHAIAEMCCQRWPTVASPVGMPIDWPSVVWASVQGQVVRTRDADPALVPATHEI